MKEWKYRTRRTTLSAIREKSPRTPHGVGDCRNHGVNGGTGVPVSQCSPAGEDRDR